MKFFERLCEVVTSALGLSKFSQWDQHDQVSIFGNDAVSSMDNPLPSVHEAAPATNNEYHSAPVQDAGLINHMDTLFPASMDPDLVDRTGWFEDDNGPIFKPPNGSPGFLCDYTAMKGWKHAGGVGARGMWLSHPNDAKHPFGGVYDIFTNYDDFAPVGITRKVCVVLNDKALGLTTGSPCSIPSMWMNKRSMPMVISAGTVAKLLTAHTPGL